MGDVFPTHRLRYLDVLSIHTRLMGALMRWITLVAALAAATGAEARSTWAPVKPDNGTTGSTGVIGASDFKPIKPIIIYSNRGGLSADPPPAKPKGYVDIYGGQAKPKPR